MAIDENQLVFALHQIAKSVTQILDALEVGDERVAPVADDAAWREFVREHPELKPERLEFTDDAVLAALAKACDEWDSLRKPRRNGWQRRGAYASCVASILAGGTAKGDGIRVAHGDVVRVGQRLGKLMREGRITCVSEPYEPRRYVPNAKRGGEADA